MSTRAPASACQRALQPFRSAYSYLFYERNPLLGVRALLELLAGSFKTCISSSSSSTRDSHVRLLCRLTALLFRHAGGNLLRICHSYSARTLAVRVCEHCIDAAFAAIVRESVCISPLQRSLALTGLTLTFINFFFQSHIHTFMHCRCRVVVCCSLRRPRLYHCAKCRRTLGSVEARRPFA